MTSLVYHCLLTMWSLCGDLKVTKITNEVFVGEVPEHRHKNTYSYFAPRVRMALLAAYSALWGHTRARAA